LLLVRLLDHGRAHLFSRLTPLDDDLLRFQPSRLDPLLLLGENAGRFFAIALCSLDCLFQRFLTGLDGGRDLRENKFAKDCEEDKEDDQRPEHQTAGGREKIARWRLRSLWYSYCLLQECENESHH